MWWAPCVRAQSRKTEYFTASATSAQAKTHQGAGDVAVSPFLRCFSKALLATPASEFRAWALQTLVIGLELVRRCFWAVLRLEAEHLYNTEGFRRIDNVPMHFDRKAQEERPELEQKSRVQLLLELGSYLLLLAALATLSAVTRGLEGGSPGGPSP